jgi:hypothetical protein
MLIESCPLASEESMRAEKERQGMWLTLIQKTALDDFGAANKDNKIPCTCVANHNLDEHHTSYS